jgi:hypothetical protein
VHCLRNYLFHLLHLPMHIKINHSFSFVSSQNHTVANSQTSLAWVAATILLLTGRSITSGRRAGAWAHGYARLSWTDWQHVRPWQTLTRRPPDLNLVPRQRAPRLWLWPARACDQSQIWRAMPSKQCAHAGAPTGEARLIRTAPSRDLSTASLRGHLSPSHLPVRSPRSRMHIPGSVPTLAVAAPVLEKPSSVRAPIPKILRRVDRPRCVRRVNERALCGPASPLVFLDNHQHL